MNDYDEDYIDERERELTHKSEVADAELGIAEEIGFATAGFAGLSTYLAWGSWLIAITVAIGVYVVATRRYFKKCNRLRDQLAKMTKTGDYAPVDSGGA